MRQQIAGKHTVGSAPLSRIRNPEHRAITTTSMHAQVVCPRFTQCRHHIPASAVHDVLDRRLQSLVAAEAPEHAALALVRVKRAYAKNNITRAVEDDPFQHVRAENALSYELLFFTQGLGSLET